MTRRDESTTDASTKTPAWAQKFVAHRQKLHELEETIQTEEKDWVVSAIKRLWTMFDEAVEQANSALAQSGSEERIKTQCTSRDYRLSMPGPVGEQRQIAVFASLRLVDGQPSGGSHITSSQTRATIHLTPSADGAHRRWIVETNGAEFSTQIVADLLLSVFGDDPTASTRLSRHYTPTL